MRKFSWIKKIFNIVKKLGAARPQNIINKFYIGKMNIYFLINININVKITIVIIKIKIYILSNFILHSKSRLTNLLARPYAYIIMFTVHPSLNSSYCFFHLV